MKGVPKLFHGRPQMIFSLSLLNANTKHKRTWTAAAAQQKERGLYGTVIREEGVTQLQEVLSSFSLWHTDGERCIIVDAIQFKKKRNSTK
jgi:hypothetical protein